MARATLVRAYRSQYPQPISLRRGETAQLGRRDHEWPEFIWATDPRGVSGWVHERWLNRGEGSAVALRDYSARELEAEAGETLELIEEAGGWWWARKSDDAQGWLPARDLEIEQDRP